MWRLWFILINPDMAQVPVGSLDDCMRAAYQIERKHEGKINVLCRKEGGIDSMYADNWPDTPHVSFILYEHRKSANKYMPRYPKPHQE